MSRWCWELPSDDSSLSDDSSDDSFDDDAPRNVRIAHAVATAPHSSVPIEVLSARLADVVLEAERAASVLDPTRRRSQLAPATTSAAVHVTNGDGDGDGDGAAVARPRSAGPPPVLEGAVAGSDTDDREQLLPRRQHSAVSGGGGTGSATESPREPPLYGATGTDDERDPALPPQSGLISAEASRTIREVSTVLRGRASRHSMTAPLLDAAYQLPGTGRSEHLMASMDGPPGDAGDTGGAGGDAAATAVPASSSLRARLPALKVPTVYLRGPKAKLRRALLGRPADERRRRRGHVDPTANEDAASSIVPRSDAASTSTRTGTVSTSSSPATSGSGSSILSAFYRMRGVTLRGFESVAAFQAAFDVACTEPLTGDIRVTDVLLSVFLFLPIDQPTLLAVSAVSRGWREASERLPQWAVVPELLHPNPMLVRFVLPDEEDAVVGVGVETRTEFLATMKARTDAKIEAGHVQSRYVVRTCCLEMRAQAFMQLLGALLVVGFFLASAFGLAMTPIYRGTRAFGEDGSLGAFVFFLPLLLGAPMMFVWVQYLKRMPPWPILDRHRNMRFRGKYSFSFLVLALVLMLTTPTALVSVRWAQARWLRDQPQAVYGLSGTRDECTDPMRDLADAQTLPTYVRIANPWEWRIEPWANPRWGPAVCYPMWNSTANKSMTAPLCHPPQRPSELPGWWADSYFNNTALQRYNAAHPRDQLAPQSAVQCMDWLMSPFPEDSDMWHEVRFVLLHPPPRIVAACPTATPIAVLYDPSKASMNDTLASIFVTNASREGAAPPGQLTTFRTPLPSLWFDTPYGHEDSRAWFQATYAGVNWTYFERKYAGQFNFTSIRATYLWMLRRVPMIYLEPVVAPEELVSFWGRRVLLMVWIALGVLGLNFVLVTLPRRILSGSCVNILAVMVLFLTCNTIWVTTWGGVCYFEDHPDTCLMSKTSAMAMFVVGIVITAGSVLISVFND